LEEPRRFQSVREGSKENIHRASAEVPEERKVGEMGLSTASERMHSGRNIAGLQVFPMSKMGWSTIRGQTVEKGGGTDSKEDPGQGGEEQMSKNEP